MSDIVERLREVAERADANYPAVIEQAADRIEQLEDALLTGVCMLSEMGLDPREKCQMAYDYMSAALGEERT